MYAMSWEINNQDYKYESIQHGYTIEFDDVEHDRDLSLDELLEKELEVEEMEIEGEVF